jgi:hypothetical protein
MSKPSTAYWSTNGGGDENLHYTDGLNHQPPAPKLQGCHRRNSRSLTMRMPIVPLSLVALSVLLGLGYVMAEDKTVSPQGTPLKIVPLVALKPGETKELLLTTHCTVGITRSDGFQLAEMRDGSPVVDKTPGYAGATYARDGVTIKLPGWAAATKFASSAPFEDLSKKGIQAFVVTVSATNDAKPGLFEMHLVDATCSGHCNTDFRVFVTAP